MMNKKCTKCQKIYPTDAQFCPTCGIALENEKEEYREVESIQNMIAGDALASGLPLWSLEPPMRMVRKKRTLI